MKIRIWHVIDKTMAGPGAPEPSYAFEEVYMRFFKKYKLTTADGTELMTFKRKMMTIGNPSIAAYKPPAYRTNIFVNLPLMYCQVPWPGRF